MTNIDDLITKQGGVFGIVTFHYWVNEKRKRRVRVLFRIYTMEMQYCVLVSTFRFSLPSCATLTYIFGA